MNLRIHNPCNEQTRYFRNYNLFWDELTDRLKQKYNVVENRYFENAHKERFNVNFNSLTNSQGLLLMECEYVIENTDNGEFYILSVADDLSSGVLTEQSNPKLKKVLISQFIEDKIKHHVGNNYEKYSPWIYFPMNLTDLESYYQKRKEKTEFIDKLCFWGATSERPILKHFDNSIFVGPNYIGDSDSYFDNLINYSIALSIAGVGELCYRDIECMALGVPLLRFEYQTILSEPLIPNYHYISLPYDDEMPRHNNTPTDRLGEYPQAKKIEERFKEVILDKDFLSFISKNARKYYEDNLSPMSRIDKTLEILNL
jgi:hypothetical protein